MDSTSVAAVVLVGVVSLLYFFRQTVFSGFNLLNGDNGDTRIMIAIVEHWSAVFSGHAAMRSPNFFWPLQGILGYSEAGLLYWPPYALMRALGCDYFLAFQITIMLFKAIGFASMFYLLKVCCRMSVAAGALGAALFTISNLYSIPIGGSHSQLVLATLIPLLAIMAWKAWQSGAGENKRAAYLSAAAFAVYLALLFFTSFYITWFAVFAGSLCLSVTFVIQCVRSHSILQTLQGWIGELLRRKAAVGVAALFFALAILPFIVTYLPVLRQTGGRGFAENLLYSARPIDILNVGGRNRVWGHPLNVLFLRLTHEPMQGTEAQAGWPPMILTVCLVGIFIGMSRRLRWSARTRLLVLSAGLAFVLSLLLSVKFGDDSLWWFVFKLVPGGSAMRVPARLNHVTNILLIVAVCVVADQVWRRSRIAFWILAAVLIAEQLNRDPVARMYRNVENAVLARATTPPAACKSFFLAKAASPDRLWYVNQIDAMLIARRFNVPTMNGYSGWKPPDWHLDEINNSYLSHVREWATTHNVAQGVCGLNLATGAWSEDNLSAPPYALGSTIDFRKNGNATDYEVAGWSGEEDTGSWTVGPRSTLELTLPDIPKTDLVLVIQAHAFINNLRPRFEESVIVNGNQVANWDLHEVPIHQQIIVPKSILTSRELQIEFVDHDPKSPQQLGMWADSRKLGISLESVELK